MPFSLGGNPSTASLSCVNVGGDYPGQSQAMQRTEITAALTVKVFNRVIRKQATPKAEQQVLTRAKSLLGGLCQPMFLVLAKSK